MSKKLLVILIILAVVLIVVAVVYGYPYYQKLKKEKAGLDALEQAGSAAEDLGRQASQGVLPSIDPQSNPMENAPDTNPMSGTNPFSNIKTNPF